VADSVWNRKRDPSITLISTVAMPFSRRKKEVRIYFSDIGLAI
jgi:hypothetical protein